MEASLDQNLIICCKFIIGLVEWIEITAAVLERIYESSAVPGDSL